MTTLVTLQVTTQHPVFWQGEGISVQVRLVTDVSAEPIEVPVPFELFQAGVTVIIRSGDGNEVTLGALHERPAQTRTLPPGNLYETELALDRAYAFEPGSYEVRVEWRPTSILVLEGTASFRVAERAAMTLSVVGSVPGDPASLHAVGTVTGMLAGEPALGALVDLVFGPDIEDDTAYTCMRQVKRYVRTEPIAAAIPVQPLPEPAEWTAGRDAKGVFARPGFEVQGMARHDWPDEDAPQVITPAIESPEGLHVYTVNRGGQLSGIVFAPPRVEIEEPSGPDDWDDEILVPGPTASFDIGSIGEGVLGARAIRANDRVNIVAVARGALLHSKLEGRSATSVARIELHVRVLSTDPAVHSDESGAVVAAVVVARDAPAQPDALELGIARVVMVADAVVEYRWLGVLEAIPVSAAVSLAPKADGAPSPLCAVLDAEHFLHVGTWSGGWSHVAAPSTLLSPLTITAAHDFPQVAVGTPEGPRLQRL